jgi:hypothetical protein
MSLKDLFHIFSKDDYEKELKKKITALETNIDELKKIVESIQTENLEQTIAVQKEPPIIIEKIHIDKILLDKYELNNNFGQLGIKELKGKLNIGATYGSEFVPSLKEEENNRAATQKKPEKNSTGEGPKVNILAKKEE